MSEIKQPKYLEDARAYELVAHLLGKALENDAFSGESKRTQTKLARILSSMERNRNKNKERAHEAPKPKKPRAKVSKITPTRHEPIVIKSPFDDETTKTRRGRR